MHLNWTFKRYQPWINLSLLSQGTYKVHFETWNIKINKLFSHVNVSLKIRLSVIFCSPPLQMSWRPSFSYYHHWIDIAVYAVICHFPGLVGMAHYCHHYTGSFHQMTDIKAPLCKNMLNVAIYRWLCRVQKGRVCSAVTDAGDHGPAPSGIDPANTRSATHSDRSG